jgi:hypothetical protein
MTATSCWSADVVAITTNKSKEVSKRDKLDIEDTKLSPGSERIFTRQFDKHSDVVDAILSCKGS